MQNVYLLGDSVRMQYEDPVRALLPGITVHTPNENCRFSAYMLNSLRFWLPSLPAPDAIHFNAGLWDTAILYVDDGPFTPIEQYVKNMLSVWRELDRYGVPVIFSTSTPVKAEQISAVATPSVDAPDAATVFKQSNERITAYNEAVTKALREKGAIINDLYGLVYPHLDEYICADGIHMSEAGIAACAASVSHAIQNALIK